MHPKMIMEPVEICNSILNRSAYFACTYKSAYKHCLQTVLTKSAYKQCLQTVLTKRPSKILGWSFHGL